ncbi:MAG: hypothetical protein A3F04_00790 [Candidatus Chisholmbacteria bacterium RIFCSPHIGHO2_12_FULL_49_9]|uniref:Uncharacterized protein n=1 Tax=Candidatus Chisholmbacteria bacterium RIFCSPHIGHO2_01_FULL_52_32 TaxID=1797591 RepID=A0A1G1VTR1_9BACT|nr:MAG: hypothetical protein A2786_04810 [Candidatus Chisholmbacteria bacterium RIFCSPHIGHO2_01_FULL_52_32]OGY19844.1 MAG: hypothetical protein A2900_01935 [Candidatus Chisholmbacteria bacterium RIFCSPLOWO2_01_FULL_50_28]OGY21040.1 MAG: hypothetical protein A3F04_00790 [Candidatus Chisholmbacteria bacterium RIFCSPHIGHO2_12_FULL_49_9]
MAEQNNPPQPGPVTPQATPPPPAPNDQPKIPPKGGKTRAAFPSLPKPHPSFLVALLTVIFTIAGGIGLAVAIGKLTQRGMKGAEESQNAPMVTIQPTVSLEPEEDNQDEGASPSAESSPSGSFGSMLDEEASEASQPASSNQ